MMTKRAALAVFFLALSFSGRAAIWSVPPDKRVAGPSPELIVSGGTAETAQNWTVGFYSVYRELLENLKMPKAPFATRYAQPGPAWPDDVYLWDTAFIAEVWRLWDVKTAQEITLAVLDHADKGRLQHAVGADQHYKDTQPPVLAWAVWRLYEKGRDRDYLAHAYPILKDYNRWLYDNRRLAGGLFFWIHPYESGMDNSPRFANRNVTRIGDMKDLAAIDLSSYMALQNETLARMAEALDLPDEAAEFKNKGEELNRLVNDLLWDEGSGLYYDRDMKKNELIKIKTIAGLVPLFCGVPDPERARKLRDHVMDPAEFNTPMPLPSVARNDPAFEKDMWRGPVWINTSYMVILGLERYGFGAEAAELSFRTADGVYRNYNLTGGFYEYYDPDHDGIEELGRKNSPYKKLSGADKPKPHFVGWTGLVNTLVIEHVLGVQNTANGWKACPNIFRGDDMVFVLNLSAEKLSLEVRAPSPDKVSGKMTAGKRCEEFDIDAGSCFILPLQ